ncbi:MAG: outer membrane protein assembly factor BamA [Burkholderiales bacterium]|nr:outer membrane protein assembly factor BamA [Burkholderiales bacterium]
MRKKLAAALVGALFAHAAYAFDPFVVRDIRVEGIQRIEAGTVFSYLPVRVGETMTEDKAREAIRVLFGTGFFKDVRIEIDGEVLVVVVEERPAIAQIDFSGMKEFSPEDVKLALRENNIAEGRIFDRAVIEKAEQEIKRQYLTRGRYGVNIQTTVTPLDRNRVAINFSVDEGEVAKIARINIVGNRAFTEDALLDLFVLTTPGWFTWYTKNDQYSRQKLSADLETLRSFYLDRGYLDFNIESTQVSITPDKRHIYITVNISEGEKYTVRDVTLSGDFVVPKEELEKLVQIKPGETFSRKKLTDTTKAITDRLGNDGYAFANANAVPDVNKEDRTVAFNIMIDPGRRVYVRRIEVAGNTRTRDEVIRREMRQLEGAYYDAQKLQLSRQRIDRLDYFTEVNVDTHPVAGTTDQVDVTYSVVEKPTGALMLGAGFSSADGLVLQGSVSQQNLFGTGNAVEINLNTSKINRNIGLSFTNPYLTVDGVSGGFDIYARRYDPRRRLSFGRYATDTMGVGLRAGVPITEFDRIHFGLAVEQTEIELFDDSPDRFKDFVDTEGDKTLGLIGTIGWSRDRRDSAFWTTSGTYQRAYIESGLPAADLQYYKINYELSWYFPLSRDLTLKLKGEAGYAAGYGGGELPFFKAFFGGGPNSVRGFEQGSLGPRDADGVLGGSRKVVGNAELLFPMPGMRQDRSVRMGVFFDAGQVWDTGKGNTLSDLKLRYSTGGFVSWNSPFGPLQLIIAYPLNEQPGDDVQKFQFTFGHAF